MEGKSEQKVRLGDVYYIVDGFSIKRVSVGSVLKNGKYGFIGYGFQSAEDYPHFKEYVDALDEVLTRLDLDLAEVKKEEERILSLKSAVATSEYRSNVDSGLIGFDQKSIAPYSAKKEDDGDEVLRYHELGSTVYALVTPKTQNSASPYTRPAEYFILKTKVDSVSLQQNPNSVYHGLVTTFMVSPPFYEKEIDAKHAFLDMYAKETGKKYPHDVILEWDDAKASRSLAEHIRSTKGSFELFINNPRRD